MLKKIHNTGFAIAIAWAETYCKQPGYWYDGLMEFLRISKNHYHKIGHAALVLIDSQKKECHYFDFGRYHTPFQYGRVRSSKTDHGLTIKTKPVISNNAKKIENYREILIELQMNAECHGEGNLHASYCSINFQKALKKAEQLQMDSPIPYGPFKYKGSNCSRFVNTSVIAGNRNWNILLKLKYLVPLTPTPLNNVNSLSNKIILAKMLAVTPFYSSKIEDKSVLTNTLPQPIRHKNIPKTAQWLSGEGAGSWFNIVPNSVNYLISRYNHEGKLECEGKFEIHNNTTYDKNSTFKFTHLSNCEKVRLQQNAVIIEFKRLV